jgi:glyoxylase-like metal-dependent hydrolase (beta-lactamase superfamily II)
VYVNTYLLYDDTREAVLIDCGAFTGEEQKQVQNYIADNGLKLKHLLNTHLHFDHVLGNHFIYETYGLRPQYNEADDQMPTLRMQAAGFGLPVNYEPVYAEHFIHNGEYIRFGNTVLKALLTPGHSPGSLSFYCEKEGCVFTGDALFRYDIGRTDLWGGNEETLIAAIKNQLLTLPENTIVYPGHGPASTIGEEKKGNDYLNEE